MGLVAIDRRDLPIRTVWCGGARWGGVGCLDSGDGTERGMSTHCVTSTAHVRTGKHVRTDPANVVGRSDCRGRRDGSLGGGHLLTIGDQIQRTPEKEGRTARGEEVASRDGPPRVVLPCPSASPLAVSLCSSHFRSGGSLEFPIPCQSVLDS